MAGTIGLFPDRPRRDREMVSMESGLDGRNNAGVFHPEKAAELVSMESGLDGRNNLFISSAAILRG